MTLQELITRQQAINARMAEIQTKAADDKTPTEELRTLSTEMEGLNKERSDVETRIALLRSEITNPQNVLTQPVNESGNGAAERSATINPEDPYSSLAYRQAFMNYVTRGEFSDILKRSGTTGTTTQSDVTSVIIPTTITDMLFKKNPRAGSLFARVRKTHYPAGMNIPKASLKPRLEWVAENGKSDKTKATTGYISFQGYKGQIRVALSLEVQVKSIEGFEEGLVAAMLEGCAASFDEVITMGDGVGKPTGIIPGADYEKKAVLMNNKQIEDYSFWIQVYSKLPLSAQSRSQLHINKSDWQAHVLGMKDSNGKVIALDTMGFGGNLVPMFMGKEVVLLEDQGVPTFDKVTGSATASKTTAFAYYADDGDYIFNTNMQLTMRDYIDEDTDEKVHKATVLADGKMADDDSLLIICRDVDAGTDDKK